MTKTQMLEVKAKIESMPHLFSARYNKDYVTIANAINEELDAKAQLTPLEVHACMAEEE